MSTSDVSDVIALLRGLSDKDLADVLEAVLPYRVTWLEETFDHATVAERYLFALRIATAKFHRCSEVAP